MFDTILVKDILCQIKDALEKIARRTSNISSANDFTDTPDGMEKLDGVCMLFMAVGESLKKIDKITSGRLLLRYPETDWKGAIGFRDIIAHHYFDIDAEQVFWICSHHVEPLLKTLERMISDLDAFD
ncbi:hypothetical protein JCM14469_15070 [Desulfatiferula olefinivorans]